MTYIDLFAGAGGLSEGFIRAGCEPVAHIEMDVAACNTLRTRAAFHYLKKTGRSDLYLLYLKGEITRAQLYASMPAEVLELVVNMPIGPQFNSKVFQLIGRHARTGQVDLIIGGPPCQAYSLVGRARSADGMQSDPRNYLYVQYAKFLEKYKPKMFVFENVLGLKSANRGAYLRDMEKLFFRKGYIMFLFTVDANNFGVLQNRKRVIILGLNRDLQSIHVPDLEKIQCLTDSKVKHLLNDLPILQAGEGVDKFQRYRGKGSDYLSRTSIRNGIDVVTQHIARPHTPQDKEIYRIAVEKWDLFKQRLDYNELPAKLKTHNNRTSFFDRFKIVAGDLPFAQTVVAHIAKDGHYYIHPDLKQNRSLTIREAARIQSFPDDYYFEGAKEGQNRTAAFKQIGNAVPPLMAQKIAEAVKESLSR